MRSPSALPALIGCVVVLSPKAALGARVPYYIYRAPPTSSPTSTPSYEPSASPSSHPTSTPSYSPSISMPPTNTPTSLMRSFAASDIQSSSFGFLLTMSLLGVLMCLFVCVGSKRARKSQCLPRFCGDQNTQAKRNTPAPAEGDGNGWSDWMPSFWPSEPPPPPVEKKKSFLSHFNSSDVQVSPAASPPKSKDHKKSKRRGEGSTGRVKEHRHRDKRNSDEKRSPRQPKRPHPDKTKASSRGRNRKDDKKPKSDKPRSRSRSRSRSHKGGGSSSSSKSALKAKWYEQQRTEELDDPGTQAWGILGLSLYGDEKKEIVENESKKVKSKKSKSKKVGVGGRALPKMKVRNQMKEFKEATRKQIGEMKEFKEATCRSIGDSFDELRTKELGNAARGKLAHTLPKLKGFSNWKKDSAVKMSKQCGNGGDDDTSGTHSLPLQPRQNHIYHEEQSSQESRRDDLSSYDEDRSSYVYEEDLDNDDSSSSDSSSSAESSSCSIPRHWGDDASVESVSISVGDDASVEVSIGSIVSSDSSTSSRSWDTVH
eukprot:scaffold9388_cov148-Skeletonema_marinoi.AAC.15